MKINSLYSISALAFIVFAAPSSYAAPIPVPDDQIIQAPQALLDAADSPETTKKAAESGDAQAASNLGYMYEYGKGMPKNQNEAIKWYKKASDGGIAEAQNNLGYIYANGKGVPKDLPQAVILYSKAAEKGLAEAQYNLGVMYTNELATQVDYVKAYMWANLAASKNNQNAVRMRDMLEKNLPTEQIVAGQRLSKEWMERHAQTPASEEKPYGQPVGVSYAEKISEKPADKPAEKSAEKKDKIPAPPVEQKSQNNPAENDNKATANPQINTDLSRPSPYDQVH